MKTLTLLNVPMAKGVRYALEQYCKEVGIDFVVLHEDMLTPRQIETQKQLATEQGKMIIIEGE